MKKTPPPTLSVPGFIILFGVILSSQNLFAQEIHPVLEIQRQFHSGDIDINEAVIQQIQLLQNHDHSHEGEFLKCLTPFYSMIEANKELLNDDTIEALNQMGREKNANTIQATETHISPGGKFRIIYETSGSHAVPLADNNTNGVPDYIDELAIAADSSYHLEVEILGYSDPIPTGLTYDIFVENTANIGAYGLTSNSMGGQFPCDNLNSGTCIYVENDFAGFPENDDPDGDVLGALRVTIAHEFKHAIQFVENGWQGDPDRWLEMDATLYEEVVYDQVNDYYNYISGFGTDLFDDAGAALNNNASSCGYSPSQLSGCYEDITFALFFHEKFGGEFWADVWQRIDDNGSILYLNAMRDELAARNESYDQNFLEAYIWHFASGSAFSSSMFGFDEAGFYPGPRISETITNLGTSVGPVDIDRSSSAYFLADLSGDTSGYIQFDYSVTNAPVNIGLVGYSNNGTVDTYVVEGSSSSLTGSLQSTWLWQDFSQIGLVLANSDLDDSAEVNFEFNAFTLDEDLEVLQNYPNPFYNNTTIRVNSPGQIEGTLEIYDVLGRHVQTAFSGMLQEGINELPVDASNLASGVYFFRFETPTRTFTRKMTVIK